MQKIGIIKSQIDRRSAMSRKSIFDVLDDIEFDLNTELKKINSSI